MFCVVALVLFSSCKRGGIDYNISDIDKKVTEEKVNALANQNINLNMASSKSVEEGAKHFDSSAVRKYLNSAVANAENNLEMNRDDLYVAETYANQGPTLMRFRPRAHGRASRIRKRTSHITVILDQRNK